MTAMSQLEANNWSGRFVFEEGFVLARTLQSALRGEGA